MNIFIFFICFPLIYVPAFVYTAIISSPAAYHKKISLMADTNSLPDFFELEAAPGEGFMEGGVVTDITGNPPM